MGPEEGEGEAEDRGVEGLMDLNEGAARKKAAPMMTTASSIRKNFCVFSIMECSVPIIQNDRRRLGSSPV